MKKTFRWWFRRWQAESEAWCDTQSERKKRWSSFHLSEQSCTPTDVFSCHYERHWCSSGWTDLLIYQYCRFRLVLPGWDHLCASDESLQMKPSRCRSRHTFPRRYWYNKKQANLWYLQTLECLLLLPHIPVKLRGEDEMCCKWPCITDTEMTVLCLDGGAAQTSAMKHFIHWDQVECLTLLLTKEELFSGWELPTCGTGLSSALFSKKSPFRLHYLPAGACIFCLYCTSIKPIWILIVHCFCEWCHNTMK